MPTHTHFAQGQGLGLAQGQGLGLTQGHGLSDGTVFPTQGQRSSYYDNEYGVGSDNDEDINIVPEAVLLQVFTTTHPLIQ